MNFEADYILEDEVARLKPLSLNYLDSLLEFSENEPELWKYSLQNVNSKESMTDYLTSAIFGRKAKKEYPFIVFDKRTNAYAGSTRFYNIDLANQTLLIGYTWYGKKFQGTGLNKHCKYLLLEFAFEKLGMKRVEFRADAENLRSINAMKRIGCTTEGILRSNAIKPDGTRRSSIVLSILQSEWQNGIKDNLKKQF